MQEKKNLKILIINHHASSSPTGGGGRHFELGKLLSEQGHYVTVICSSYGQRRLNHLFKESVVEDKQNKNYRFLYLKTKPAYKSNFLRFVNYYDFMKKAFKIGKTLDCQDVVIASSVHPLSWIAGHKLSKRFNAKYIVEVRDLWPLSLYEDFKGLTRKLVFRFFESLERKYYREADAIVTTAPYAYEYIEDKFKVTKQKVIHIPHGINIARFDSNLKKSGEELDKSLLHSLNNYFCITYTGSLSRSEGLETLVKAAKDLTGHPELRVVLVGAGNQKSFLQSLIKEEGLNNVYLFDKVYRDLVPLILKKSGILFCGLRERKAFYYGISKNKFYDYMAAGKPIIFASSVRDSLISRAQAGITIPPNNPKQLVSCILELYNNEKTTAENYGENGRRYVEKHHTTEVIAEKFLRVIYDVLEKGEG